MGYPPYPFPYLGNFLCPPRPLFDRIGSPNVFSWLSYIWIPNKSLEYLDLFEELRQPQTWSQTDIEDKIKMEDYLKKEDNHKNEDDFRKEDNSKNEKVQRAKKSNSKDISCI